MAGSGAGVAETAEFIRQAIAHRPTDATAYSIVKHNLQDAVDAVVDEGNSVNLCRLLESFCLCISSLDRKCEDLVHITLQLDWFRASAAALEMLGEFVAALVSAHSLYTEQCMAQISRIFLGPESDQIGGEIEPEEVINKACVILNEVRRIVPSETKKLVAQLSARCPHVRNETRVHEYYVRALLQFATIDPANLASLLLPLVVEATLKVDLDTADYGSECGSEVDEDELADDDELFEFDDDEPPAVEEEEVEVEEEVAVELEREEEEPASHRLDVMMSLTLEFLHHVAAQDVRVAQALFQTLWQSFETTILPTYQTKHVQYLLFYICSLEEALPSAFIERLLTKALSVGAPLLVRQTAVAYVGSYVSRANYVDMACTRGALTALCGWLNEYIRDQATVADPQALRTNSQQHIAFYANCQAVLYILCFRLEDLLDMEGGATFVSSLGLNMIVKSSLCPLLVCQKIVVKEFARLTKEHQIVYCAQYMRRQSVISLPVQLERGYRAAPSAMEPAPNQLEDFFPFDPYLLQRSISVIEPLFRAWTGGGIEEVDSSGDSAEEDDDEDDFLGTSPTSSTTSSLSSSSLTNRGRHHGHAADRRHTAGPSASLAPGRDIPHKKRARTLGVAGQDWAAGFAGTPVSPFSLDHKRPSRPSSREDEFKYLTS